MGDGCYLTGSPFESMNLAKRMPDVVFRCGQQIESNVCGS